MRIGYIQVYDLKLNPHLKRKFEFIEAGATRRTANQWDRVYSKMLQCPVEYSEVVDNANIMKKNPRIILVQEPFLLDDELREKVVAWVKWANSAEESEYAPFVGLSKDAEAKECKK